MLRYVVKLTLIPSRASLSSDCCCVSARVRDLRPLKIMGSSSWSFKPQS